MLLSVFSLVETTSLKIWERSPGIRSVHFRFPSVARGSEQKRRMASEIKSSLMIFLQDWIKIFETYFELLHLVADIKF